MFYKLIKNKNIIGVITEDNFRKLHKKLNIPLFADEETGQFIEYKEKYYYDNWLRTLPKVLPFEIILINIIRIEESEFKDLERQFDNGDIPQDNSLEEIVTEELFLNEEPIIIQKTAVQIINERFNDIENALIELADILSKIK